MMSRPLSDRELTAGLRVHLPAAQAGLHARILDQIATTPQQPRPAALLGRLMDADPIARRRAMLLVALGALALSISVAAAAGAWLRQDRGPDLSVVPPADPTPTPGIDENVRGWPGTAENPPGTYSWGGGCASAYCIKDWMHNGYGSGDVQIRIHAIFRDPVTDDRWTAATVAGHEGWHRRSDELTEEWRFLIEDAGVSIMVLSNPGTSPTDLAEAHAIVGSMRTVPSDNEYGFRLIFTLATGNWDSG